MNKPPCVAPSNLPRRSEEVSQDSTNSYYYLAKKYQYEYKNLDMAINYYQKAIEHGEKVDSALKDMAAVMHQVGRTRQAVDFLNRYRSQYKGDLEKYDNLRDNLYKQIATPSGKNWNKYLLLTGLKDQLKNSVSHLFGNYSRVQEQCFYGDLAFSVPGKEYCLLKFGSYSAARKTLDTFQFEQHPQIQLYWVNINRLIICEANLGKELSTDLNSYYYGFCSFENSLEIVQDTEFYCMADLKEAKIDQIWAEQEVATARDSQRVMRENMAKLEILRHKKVSRASNGFSLAFAADSI